MVSGGEGADTSLVPELTKYQQSVVSRCFSRTLRMNGINECERD